MSRESVLIAALTQQPASTSDVYARVGYAALTEIGLVPYDKFKGELGRLQSAGLILRAVGADGTTTWWRPRAPQL
jgi:hypothetical protein